jgi:hypothetical protein
LAIIIDIMLRRNTLVLKPKFCATPDLEEVVGIDEEVLCAATVGDVVILTEVVLLLLDVEIEEEEGEEEVRVIKFGPKEVRSADELLEEEEVEEELLVELLLVVETLVHAAMEGKLVQVVSIITVPEGVAVPIVA